MKKSVFALCLLATGAVYAQTNSESTTSGSMSSTTTTTNTNMSSSPTYNANTTGTMSGTESMGTGTTSNGTYSSGSTGNTTGTGAMNSAPTYNATTTTTTTTSDYGTTPTRTRDTNGDRAWGKDGKFGVYAGLNFSRFVNEPIPDDAYRTGWQAGIYGRSGGTIFGQIGLEYRNSTSNLVRSGSAIGNPTSGTATTGADVRGQIDQHFLAIPAYVGARIGALAGLRLQAGLELSSLVSIGNNNFNLNRDDLNRTILNGLLGAGINLGPVTLDAVYNHGLQNVFDNADTKRRMWAFNVGFRF
ncbi:PorT family protein [Rudanella lutea]|uniref:PorT family protein n=1 Tax=Rudanella lutea TaxID=451374 RepID=UPI001FE23DEF|nr:PorT family protein [Rudanella lutea]